MFKQEARFSRMAAPNSNEQRRHPLFISCIHVRMFIQEPPDNRYVRLGTGAVQRCVSIAGACVNIRSLIQQLTSKIFHTPATGNHQNRCVSVRWVESITDLFPQTGWGVLVESYACIRTCAFSQKLQGFAGFIIIERICHGNIQPVLCRSYDSDVIKKGNHKADNEKPDNGNEST